MGGAKLAEKPEKKILNPQEKLAAITRVKEGGETKASVARDLGIPESTLRGWCKNSLRINYQSNRSSPDTDDALKLSPSGKRRSLSSGGTKKKSRRPSVISPTSALNSSSTLAELNRLKAEYGLSRVNEYLNQPIGTSPGLDAAMQGWALQMQMLLQASVAASTQDTTPSINTPHTATTSQVTSTTSTVDTSLLSTLRPPLTDTSNNSLYLSSITPSSLNFPPTTSSFGSFSSSLTNPFLMSYLANLDPSSTTPTTVAKTPKYSLSPQYQNTPKCPWRSNSPTAYVQPFASSGSSSASVSPRSRTSLNSQNLNEYYGTDEEGPIDMSTSNEDSSSDSLSLRTNQVSKDEPMDFSSGHNEKNEDGKIDDQIKEMPNSTQPNLIQPNSIHGNLSQGNSIQGNSIQGNSIQSNSSQGNSNQGNSLQSNSIQGHSNQGNSNQGNSFQVNSLQANSNQVNSIQANSNQPNSTQLIEINEKIEENEVKQKDEGILFNELTKPEQNDEEKEEIHGKKLESVLESVFQVTNNNTIVSLNGGKPVSNEEAIECGEIFLKFLETAKDPNVTASQITQVRHILGNIKSGNVPKNGEQRKPKPDRLLSPHTVFLRKSGTSFDIATALCSLLLGLNYDAYVVSGYAARDATLKIMTRVDSPYPEFEEKKEEVKEEEVDPKYVLKPPRDLRSKFLIMMEQREIDKANEEKRLIEEEKKRQIEEMEKPPYDELHGLRVHAWILIRPGKRDIEEVFFIEPSTGYQHKTNSELYCGIESVWNNENYWVNMQDCSQGIAHIDFDFSNIKNWEHLLLGEPAHSRVSKFDADMEDEEIQLQTLYQEKHLDMPIPWSSRIDIPHEVIQKRYPEGLKTTWYKRTIVEEFAPYINDDGLVARISRFHDLECSPDQMYVMEERFANRQDKMVRRLNDPKTGWRDVYFVKGREDAIKRHIYTVNDNELESPRIIEYFSENRFDSMSKIELDPLFMTEHYINTDDKLSYRHVKYAKRGRPPPGFLEGPRRIIMTVIEKFDRNPSKKASEDIAYREFDIIEKEIRLKYHYDVGKVTASTRKFIKPPMAEMGDRLTFDPALTSGYQAEIGAPPPRQLTLFNLLEQQINAEKECLREIREIEDQLAEWLKLREHERNVPKLDISIFNREQNITYKKGMQERERKQKESREKEVEEDIDFLGRYLIKVTMPGKVLPKNKAIEIEQECLNDFKKLMVARATDIQHQFERTSNKLQERQQWYSSNLDTVTLAEEEAYFREMNDTRFWLHTLQIRLVRLRELSGQRYLALVKYLQQHPALGALYSNQH